jgi:VanZ family protein
MRLSTRLALGAFALTLLLSLYPFVGWRHTGVAWWIFLIGGMPRVVPVTDLIGNVLAYVPLSALVCLAWREAFGPRLAIAGALLLCSAMSLGMEALQNYLPTRVPSNIDFAANVSGACVGILVEWRWGHWLSGGGRVDRAWLRLRANGRAQEAGLVVLGLWVLTQWSPQYVPFAIGSIRQLLDIDGPARFSAERFALFETVIVTAGVLAAGLVTALMLRRRRHQAAIAVILFGLIAKGVGMTLLGTATFGWATPGVLRGLAMGVVLLLLLAGLRPDLQRVVMSSSLMVAVAVANLIPDNPYQLPSLPAFPAAQWLNLDGLSRLANALWPVVAMSWLLNLKTER